MILICCAPYLYHYTCRRHSFYHRHKCSRSFVRYCSYIFHYAVFFCSLVGAICILSLNVILISSVHILGSNNIPPEIDRICITLLPRSRSIHASILPSPVFDGNKLEHQVNSEFLDSDGSATTECKPLWEDGGLGLGLRRKEAGPWQTRRKLGNQLIAVATQVVLNNTVPDDAHLELRFDHSLMHQMDSHGEQIFSCTRGIKSGWWKKLCKANYYSNLENKKEMASTKAWITVNYSYGLIT
uniref:Lectin_legB domain-containing protein n=1 Tax=Heterorhabditis bacteriophora TaxID=37862 RepID=A0A1I7X5W4_HETBA